MGPTKDRPRTGRRHGARPAAEAADDSAKEAATAIADVRVPAAAAVEEPAAEAQRLDAEADEAPPIALRRLPPSPGRSLADMRAAVDRELLRDASTRGRLEVQRESAVLELRLRRVQNELDDLKESGLLGGRSKPANGATTSEAKLWRAEVEKLRDAEGARLRDAEEAKAEAARHRLTRDANLARDREAELFMESRRLAEVEHHVEEMRTAQDRSESETISAEQEAVDLRQRLGRTAALGAAGAGTAQLFVAALPVLDLQAVQCARDAVAAQLRLVGARPL